MTLLDPRQLPPSGAGYTVKVTINWQSVQLDLGGDVDVLAAAGLTMTLDSIDRMPAMTVHVNMADVTFLDATGVRPLVEAARRRRDFDWPPLLIASPSRPVVRLLRATGLGPGPQLDIDRWDKLGNRQG
jgi:anti-anti-sigma factor